MSHSEEFLSKVGEIITDARIRYAGIIDAMPINEDAAKRYGKPNYRMLPDTNVIPKDREREIVKQSRDIGRECAEKLITHFKDKIVVRTQGHNKKPDGVLLEDFGSDNFRLSIKNIINCLDFGMGILVCNLAKDTADLDVLAELEKTFDFIDHDTGNFKIYGPSSHHNCLECGQELNLQLDMDKLEVVLGEIQIYKRIENRGDFDFEYVESSPCKYPDGLGEYSVEIPVPSGKLVIANRLCDIVPRSDYTDVNSYIGNQMGHYCDLESAKANKHHSEFYEKKGVMYLCGENAYPQIFKDKKTGLISIKNEEIYDDETEEELPNHTDDEEKLGDLSMDLRASTAMDYSLFLEYCESSGRCPEEVSKELGVSVVKVKPGKYKATNFAFTERFKKGLFVEIREAG